MNPVLKEQMRFVLEDDNELMARSVDIRSTIVVSLTV
jgi:hypothetical protein